MGATAAGFEPPLAIMAMRRSSPARLEASRLSLKVYAVFMWLANLTMVRALLQDDFSVSYVAKVGSRASPDWVKVVSLWSSLEGSILLWGAARDSWLVLCIFDEESLSGVRSGSF